MSKADLKNINDDNPFSEKDFLIASLIMMEHVAPNAYAYMIKNQPVMD
jgi:hypothetical protein